jgi:hypothetical protein
MLLLRWHHGTVDKRVKTAEDCPALSGYKHGVLQTGGADACPGLELQVTMDSTTAVTKETLSALLRLVVACAQGSAREARLRLSARISDAWPVGDPRPVRPVRRRWDREL